MAGETSATAQNYTLYLDQSAHLDWDWIRTFAQNYWYYSNGHGVDRIIAKGIANAQAGRGAYYYTVCEMGFLRRFIEENPAQADSIRKLGENFQVIGGGVTSPDCLVCSGEGFIRNYLVGRTWLKSALGLSAKPHCWLPDDFGQGPELPALLAALGFVSMSFSRLPGTWGSCPRPELAADLKLKGFDFRWKASDGSAVYAHWMPNTYAFGNKLWPNSGPREPGAINDFVDAYGPTGNPVKYTGATTPFMYIPIDNDFSMPIDGLAQDISDWNSDNPNVAPGGATATGVKVVQGTFDQFMTSVIEDSHPLAVRAPYNGTPYWTGYYASRPALKALHYETVRALVAAEVFGLLTQPADPSLNSMLPTRFWSDLDDAWTDFAPSTHHDYVCGTAPDAVYAGDQLPLLRGVAARARALRAAALNALAGMAPPASVIVANPLGFARTGIAEIESIARWTDQISWAGGSTSVTQPSAEGGMLVAASLPSFAYMTDGWNGTAALPATAALSPAATGADAYVLSNEYLSATISAAANWGIAGLVDGKSGGAELLKAGAVGNDIAFYDDSLGDIYQFANESDGNTMPRIGGATFAVAGPGLGAVVLESGPLRVRVRTTVLITVDGAETVFTREYSLCAGEPFLRMSTTGSAPMNMSVMTVFPLAETVASIAHGTAGHWTEVQPMDGYWDPPVFRAAHDFLLPRNARAEALAAVYHRATPAWAIDAKGALIGCLLRNLPSDRSHGANGGGSDPAAHTHHYAIRVPTGLGPPGSGQPLREALAFSTPLEAMRMPAGGAYPGMLPAGSASLASVSGSSAAVLTVAKPGSYDPTSLVLRLYQPTNSPLQVVVDLPGGAPSAATLVTAAETGWDGRGSAAPAAGGIAVAMAGALATVRVGGLGRRSGPPIASG